jgi:hypothetical protein
MFQSTITRRTSWEFITCLGFEYSVIVTKKRRFTWSFLVRPSQRKDSVAGLTCAIAVPGLSLVSPVRRCIAIYEL